MALGGEVARQAAVQGGYVTRAQLIDLGLSESSIDRLVNSSEIKVVVPSLYQAWDSGDHTDLIRGACLGLPKATASHESAAHILEFPRLPRLRPTVTVAAWTTHRFPGVVVRRCADLDNSQITKRQGIPVTNVARTTFDLAAVLPYRLFEEIAEGLMVGGRLELSQLVACLDRLGRRGKPGTRAIRHFVGQREDAGPRASRLEVLARRVLRDGGLPVPISEFPIPWNESRRFDDAYPEARVAIEWDSRAWHSQRKAMTADRKRDRTAALHGWTILRFTWDDVVDTPSEVAETVRSILAERHSAGA